MENFRHLIAGESAGAHVGAYAGAIEALLASLNRTTGRLAECITTTDHAFLVDFGPTVGRRVIEEALAVLHGKLDPLRLVVALNGSKSGDFETGRPNRSSYSWSSDVVPTCEPSVGIWTQRTLEKKEGIVRGVLSGHLAHSVFFDGFLPALDGFQAALGDQPVPPWVVDIQRFEAGDHLLADIRRRALTTYSSLSKGIHFEFLPTAGYNLQPVEIVSLLRQVIFITSTTALIINASRQGLGRIDDVRAAELFVAIAQEFGV